MKRRIFCWAVCFFFSASSILHIGCDNSSAPRNAPSPSGVSANFKFISTAPTYALPGEGYEYAPMAEGAESVSYALVTGPSTMIMTPTGALQWTPTQADSGQHKVVISAQRGMTSIFQEYQVVVPQTQNLSSVQTIPSQATTIILPSSAGQLAGLIVRIPAGALISSENISIRAPHVPPASDEQPFGPMFILGRDQSDMFQASIEVEVPYDPNSLPKGQKEDDLVVTYWDGVNWIPLDTSVDKQNHRLLFTTNHFSSYSFDAGYLTYETPPGNFKLYFRNPLLASSGYITELGLAFEDAFLFYARTKDYLEVVSDALLPENYGLVDKEPRETGSLGTWLRIRGFEGRRRFRPARPEVHVLPGECAVREGGLIPSG